MGALQERSIDNRDPILLWACKRVDGRCSSYTDFSGIKEAPVEKRTRTLLSQIPNKRWVGPPTKSQTELQSPIQANRLATIRGARLDSVRNHLLPALGVAGSARDPLQCKLRYVSGKLSPFHLSTNLNVNIDGDPKSYRRLNPTERSPDTRKTVMQLHAVPCSPPLHMENWRPYGIRIVDGRVEARNAHAVQLVTVHTSTK